MRAKDLLALCSERMQTVLFILQIKKLQILNQVAGEANWGWDVQGGDQVILFCQYNLDTEISAGPKGNRLLFQRIYNKSLKTNSVSQRDLLKFTA